MQLDFAAIKARVPIEVAAFDFLNLPMTGPRKDKHDRDQWRGVCPACQSSDNRKLVVTKGAGAKCWDADRGGDAIWLVAHIRKIPVREAAQALQDRFLTRSAPERTPSTPEPTRSAPDDLAAKLQKVKEGLDYTHALIADGLQLSEDQARKLAIGYKRRGMFAGSIVFPLYLDGELISFAGWHPEKGLSLPPKIAERL